MYALGKAMQDETEGVFSTKTHDFPKTHDSLY